MQGLSLSELRNQLNDSVDEKEYKRLASQIADLEMHERIQAAKARAAVLEAEEQTRAEDQKRYKQLVAAIGVNHDQAHKLEQATYEALKALFDNAEELTELERARMTDWEAAVKLADIYGFDRPEHPKRGFAGVQMSVGGSAECDLEDWISRYRLQRAHVRGGGIDLDKITLDWVVNNNEFFPHLEQLK